MKTLLTTPTTLYTGSSANFRYTLVSMRRISLRSCLTFLLVSVLVLIIIASSIGLSVAGCGGGASVTQAQNLAQAPFSLSIVSGRRDGITMAKNGARAFYVVLTNISHEPQPVWEYWNSWGFQAISFELTTSDGKKFVLRTKDRDFDKNFPSTFVVDPGEHQVFPILFDDSWAVEPALAVKHEMLITLKAIYSVGANPDSAKFHVWTGRVDSHAYSFTLLQY